MYCLHNVFKQESNQLDLLSVLGKLAKRLRIHAGVQPPPVAADLSSWLTSLGKSLPPRRHSPVVTAASVSGSSSEASASSSSSDSDVDEQREGEPLRIDGDLRPRRGPTLSTVSFTSTGLASYSYTIHYKKVKVGTVSAWGEGFRNFSAQCHQHPNCRFSVAMRRAPPDIDVKKWIIKGWKCTKEQHADALNSLLAARRPAAPAAPGA